MCGACAGVYVCHGKCGARGGGIPTPLPSYRGCNSALTSAKGKWLRRVWIRAGGEFEKIWSTEMMRDEELVARLTCDILKHCRIVHVVDGSHIENALSILAKH